MEDSSSSFVRSASKEADENVERSRWNSPDADVSISHHAFSFKYVGGFLSVQKSVSNTIELVVVYVTGIVTSAESRHAACSEVRRNRINTKAVRKVSS